MKNKTKINMNSFVHKKNLLGEARGQKYKSFYSYDIFNYIQLYSHFVGEVLCVFLLSRYVCK